MTAKRTKLSAVLVLFAFLLGSAATASAHTSVTEQFKCPIDGTRFEATVDASGTQFGVRLDLRPMGPTPAPWTLPVCPKCRFVLFQEKLDRKSKKRLRPFIHSREYQSLMSDHSPYFLFARILEFLEADDQSIAHVYLQASWEVEGDPDQYRDYLRAARDAFSRASEQEDLERKDRIEARFMTGEIDRQLGDFEGAEAELESLAATLEPSDDRIWPVLIAYERKLIAARDSAPRETPDPNPE
jgi:hypothetical protein